jgi:TRAP-type C4-dicarboxylate transport system substrate-binding protein
MKKSLISLSVLTLSSFTFTAQAQTVLTVSSWVPPTHGLSVAQKEWCDDVAAKTSNRVRCNILPRAVTPAPGTFDAVKNGLVDVSFTVHGYTPGRFVLTQMAEFPFLGDRAEPLSVAFNRIASKNPEFAAEHQGVKVLGYFTHGPGMVFNTKKPITRVEDLTGLKFRVGGGMVNEITKTLDMNVTLKPAPDSYELLSSGVMDGTLFPAESTDSFKIDKIIKHATTFPGGLYNTSFVFMMNPAKYNALSADDKKVVDALSGDAVAARFGKSWDRVDAAAMTNMQKNGVKIVNADNGFVSGVTVRVNKLERDWAAAAKAKGLKDPSGALAEFRAEIAKLQKQK